MIKITKRTVAPTKVYDAMVLGTHCFFANNILVHNCEVVLPSESFERLDDAGSLTFEHNGKDVTIDNMATAVLSDGSEKLVRFIDSDDDVISFILPNGQTYQL